MNPKEYIKNVLVTEARDFVPLQERFSRIRNIRLLHGAIGLASELAEISEMAAGDREEIDAVNLKEESGDLFWYMGIMIDELQLDPQEILGHASVLDRKNYEYKRSLLLEEIGNMTVSIGISIDLLKKSLMYGKELNVEALAKQLKNVAAAVEFCLNSYGFTGDQARERNIEKLRARYGDKFTEAAALERNLTVERDILEKK